MDISISSNFERLLFDLYDRDGAIIKTMMKQLNSDKVTLSDNFITQARNLFDSHRVDDQQICEQISKTYNQAGYVLDPHSAIGVKAGHDCRVNDQIPMISLATAHPAKFPEAILKAGDIPMPELPDHMKDLFNRTERYQVIGKNLSAVHRFIAENLSV